MDKFENKQMLSTEIQISDELSDDELTLVSGGCRRRDPSYEQGKRAGDVAERKVKNAMKRGAGFVVGFFD